nr:MAG TPA: hypothetical protein [Caudoviricetes sp.]
MAYKKNKEKNEDYVGKVLPNSEGGKLLIVQYNPADKDRKSWLSVAAECVKNDQKRDLQLISVARGDTADQIYALLTGKNAK